MRRIDKAHLKEFFLWASGIVLFILAGYGLTYAHLPSFLTLQSGIIPGVFFNCLLLLFAIMLLYTIFLEIYVLVDYLYPHKDNGE